MLNVWNIKGVSSRLKQQFRSGLHTEGYKVILSVGFEIFFFFLMILITIWVDHLRKRKTNKQDL